MANSLSGKLNPARWAWIILSAIAIVASWWGVAALEDGLQSRRFERDDVPLIFLAPEGAKDVPGVIVAHGFSGSKQLMLGYGYTMSRTGYAVMLLDLAGHGANEQPMDSGGDVLQQSLDVAYEALTEMPEVDLPAPH